MDMIRIWTKKFISQTGILETVAHRPIDQLQPFITAIEKQKQRSSLDVEQHIMHVLQQHIFLQT